MGSARRFLRDTVQAWRAPVARPEGLHRAVHLGLGLLLAGLAAVLALPPRSFAGPAFTWFLRIGSECAWSRFYAASALVAFWGLFTRRWLVRFGVSLAVGTAHWLTALLFLLSNPAATGTVAYSFPAGLAWYLAWSYRHAPR